MGERGELGGGGGTETESGGLSVGYRHSWGLEDHPTSSLQTDRDLRAVAKQCTRMKYKRDRRPQRCEQRRGKIHAAAILGESRCRASLLVRTTPTCRVIPVKEETWH